MTRFVAWIFGRTWLNIISVPSITTSSTFMGWAFYLSSISFTFDMNFTLTSFKSLTKSFSFAITFACTSSLAFSFPFPMSCMALSTTIFLYFSARWFESRLFFQSNITFWWWRIILRGSCILWFSCVLWISCRLWISCVLLCNWSIISSLLVLLISRIYSACESSNAENSKDKNLFHLLVFRIEIEYITNSIGTNLYYNIELFQNIFLTFRN